MRIAFNALLLSEPHTGTGRYVYNLLSALGQMDPTNEYHILSSQTLPERPETPPSMRWETAPVPRLAAQRRDFEKLVWEQRTFPRAAQSLSADLIHIPYFAPPLRTLGVPSLVTILDVIAQRLPVYRASSTKRLYSQLVSKAAHRASAIIAISNHCKQDIVDLLGIEPDRIEVTYLAPDPRLRPMSYEAQQELRQRLLLPGPFVLNVGGMDVRKNISGLIEAFAEVYRQFGNPDLRLFIAGKPDKLGTSAIIPDWRPLAQKLGIADKVICAPVAEADLATIYSAADCFAFTSLYEGFGLTPLEAMACGAPVVCSNTTSLPEVTGDAALLLDPLDIRALSAAILRVLTSSETAQQLRIRGFARAKQFTWERVALQTLDAYTKMTREMSRT